MKNKILLLVFSLTMILALSACGAVPSNPNAFQRQMNASGTGQIFITPDIAYINIGVRSESPEVATALNDNNRQAKAVAEKLAEFGVDPKDIQTSAFNVYPYPQYGPDGMQSGTTYAVDNTIYVTLRDLQQLGTILDAVVRAGANTINGIQFDVVDKEEAMKEARKMAIDNAKLRAQELADATGVQLGDILMVNVYSSGTAVPMYEAKVYGGYGGSGMAPEVPASSGQLTILVTADLLYEIK